MKLRLYLFFSINVVALSIFSQVAYEAHVVDESSGEPLFFALIKGSNNNCIYSNSEGFFKIRASPKDSLHFSYTGYESRTIQVSQLPPIVTLKPLIMEIKELTVDTHQQSGQCEDFCT